MKSIESSEPLNYLWDHRQNQPSNRSSLAKVSTLFPKEFKYIYKLFPDIGYCKEFPIEQFNPNDQSVQSINFHTKVAEEYFDKTQWGRIKSEKLQSISWSAIAHLNKLPFTALFNVSTFENGLPINLHRSDQIEIIFWNKIINILHPDSVVHYEIFDGEFLPDELEGRGKFEGKLADFPELFIKINTHNVDSISEYPNYMIEANKKWAFINIIVGTGFILFGSINPVEWPKEIEFFQLDHADSFTHFRES
jgi:hypothetical protein